MSAGGNPKQSRKARKPAADDIKRAKRARTVVAIEFSGAPWAVDYLLPNIRATVLEHRDKLPGKRGQALSERTLEAFCVELLQCISDLTERRSNALSGGSLAQSVKRYQQLEIDLSRALATWNATNHSHPNIPDIFDQLAPMRDEARRRAATLTNKSVKARPIEPWEIFVADVAGCFERAGLSDGTTGREEGPSSFQSFLCTLNGVLPALLKEEARTPDALAKKIQRVMRNRRTPGDKSPRT